MFILLLILYSILENINTMYDNILVNIQNYVISEKITYDEVKLLYNEFQKLENKELILNNFMYNIIHTKLRNIRDNLELKYAYLVLIRKTVNIKSGYFDGIYFVDQNTEAEFGYTPPGHVDHFIRPYKVVKKFSNVFYLKTIFYHHKYGQQKSLLVKFMSVDDNYDVYLGLDYDLTKIFGKQYVMFIILILYIIQSFFLK